MRVMFWPETFPPAIGGVEVLAAKLLPDLRERGYDFIVVTPTEDVAETAEYAGIPVHRFPFWGALRAHNLEQMMRLRQQLAQLKRAFKPDLVHIYAVGPSNVFQHLTARAHPAPLLVTLHETGEDESVRPDTVVGSTLRSADWIATCSDFVLRGTWRQIPEITSRSSAVLNALAMPAIPPGPLPFDSPRLLLLGRLVRNKGVDLALAAFASLAHRCPAARLVVAGDGPARAELEEEAGRLGLAGRVDFLGWVEPEDVPALLNTATVVIVPSRWEEPFALVALQAAQMARPVVATRLGGLPEVVVDGETGLLVEPEDSRALAAATAFLLDRPETARRLGEAARCRARAVFDWERHVEAYDALYRKLGGAGPRAGVPPR